MSQRTATKPKRAPQLNQANADMSTIKTPIKSKSEVTFDVSPRNANFDPYTSPGEFGIKLHLEDVKARVVDYLQHMAPWMWEYQDVIKMLEALERANAQVEASESQDENNSVNSVDGAELDEHESIMDDVAAVDDVFATQVKAKEEEDALVEGDDAIEFAKFEENRKAKLQQVYAELDVLLLPFPQSLPQVEDINVPDPYEVLLEYSRAAREVDDDDESKRALICYLSYHVEDLLVDSALPPISERSMIDLPTLSLPNEPTNELRKSQTMTFRVPSRPNRSWVFSISMHEEDDPALDSTIELAQKDSAKSKIQAHRDEADIFPRTSAPLRARPRPSNHHDDEIASSSAPSSSPPRDVHHILSLDSVERSLNEASPSRGRNMIQPASLSNIVRNPNRKPTNNIVTREDSQVSEDYSEDSYAFDLEENEAFDNLKLLASE